MSLDKIVEKILDDAQAEAGKITAETRKKAEEIKESSRREGERLAEELIQEAEKKARLEASRIVTQARLEKRIQILAQKKKIIDEILEKALQKTDIGEREFKKRIVLKDGIREESYGREKLVEELRPKLENFIVEVLKI